jgi:tetratricopeptide (TPR) repeat protein
LRGILNWSHGLLSESERVLLRRLAIFVGGFTLEAAAAVATDERIDKSTVIELLSHLVERSLVVADTNAARARYRLLETTRAYALEKLAEAGEVDAIKRRHAQHYRDWLEPAFDDWLRLSDSAWHDLYFPERDNIRGALDWALGPSGDAAIGVALAGASGDLWIWAGNEGRQRLEAAIARVDSDTPKADQARLWVWLGWHRSMGKPALAAACLERAIKLYRGLEETPFLGIALAILGGLQAQLGRLEDSARALAKASRALERSGRPRALAYYFGCLGTAALMTGDPSTARIHHEKALKLYREAGCEDAALGALANLANVTWALGDLDAALAASLEAIAQLRKSPFARKYRLGVALLNLAGVHTERGAFDEALAAAREGLPLLQEAGFAWNVLDYLALRAALAGKLEDAARIAGYADSRYTAQNETREPNEARACERLQALLRDKLDAEKIERLLAEGAKLSEDEACRLSLEE